MGYSTPIDVERVLANTLTSASPSSQSAPVNLLSVGTTLDFNVINQSIVEQYIVNADEEINSAISELYATPLCERADFETTLLSDINEYNPYIITSNTCPFYVGDVLILDNGTQEERHIVESVIDIVDRDVFETLDSINYHFLSVNTRVVRIKYPEPIRLMSARFAAANVYEKYFMAEASPSQSEYGKWIRGLVRMDINNILNGRTILHGQQKIGRRFYNSNLVDQYGLPHNKGENNIDPLE